MQTQPMNSFKKRPISPYVMGETHEPHINQPGIEPVTNNTVKITKKKKKKINIFSQKFRYALVNWTKQSDNSKEYMQKRETLKILIV